MSDEIKKSFDIFFEHRDSLSKDLPGIQIANLLLWALLDARALLTNHLYNLHGSGEIAALARWDAVIQASRARGIKPAWEIKE